MTHLSVPPEERAVLGITDTLVILLVNTLIVNKPAVVNKLFLLINQLLLINLFLSYCSINVFCVSIIISINWRGHAHQNWWYVTSTPTYMIFLSQF